jgi:hypothetical protein
MAQRRPRICKSVPQIVVFGIFTIASEGARTLGRDGSSRKDIIARDVGWLGGFKSTRRSSSTMNVLASFPIALKSTSTGENCSSGEAGRNDVFSSRSVSAN